MTTPYTYIKQYPIHGCLLDPNPSRSCTQSSTRMPNVTFDRISSVYNDLSCNSESDSIACRYIIADMSNALADIDASLNTSTQAMYGKREELDKSIAHLKEITNKDVPYPTAELYSTTMATGTLWLILGTTMMYYVFKNL